MKTDKLQKKIRSVSTMICQAMKRKDLAKAAEYKKLLLTLQRERLLIELEQIDKELSKFNW